MGNAGHSWSARIAALVVVGSIVFIPISLPASQDPLSVELACPITIPSSGGPLTITLTLTNRTSTARTIAKSALAVHLGNLNLMGPFIVPFTRTLAPRATQVVPYVSTTFPAGTAAAGTLVSIGVTMLDSGNKPIGSKACLVQIL